ncbi:MAG: class I SAM-dependent methyltransferase [Anaerolineales bacterium]|nr:class I SAM-dependent methyltransferase [Anaerolineales bacterium]
MTPPAFFNRIARYYDPLTHLYMFGTYAAVRRRILNTHGDGREVLDICCGTGYIGNAVQAQRVVGIDLSLPMLRVNQQKQRRTGRGSHLVNGNIRTLPFQSGQFEEVYFTLAAHEFPDLEDVLREVHRVTRPGARLTVYDLYETPNPLYRLMLHTFYYYLVEQRCMWVYTPEGWRALLERVGFRLASLQAPYGPSALVQAVRQPS